MADKEKVIKWLEVVRNAIVDGYIHEPDLAVNAITDALAILKEQEERIGVLTRALEQMPKPTKLLDVYGDGYAKVVHCKNCKYCEYPDAEKEWCKKGHLHRNAETWFCADGERK